MNPYEWAGVVSAVALAVVGMLRAVWMKALAQRAAKEIAERKVHEEFLEAIVKTQQAIAVQLGNHNEHDLEVLRKISEHMGTHVEAIRGVQAALIAVQTALLAPPRKHRK